MRYTCCFLLSILVCFIFVSGAHAQQDEVEIQFGAFKTKNEAEKHADMLARQLRRTVYVSPLAGDSQDRHHTVRTGPFDSADQAESFMENADPDTEISAWIMERNSMKPALAEEFTLTPDQNEKTADPVPDTEIQTAASRQDKNSGKEEEEEEEEEDSPWGEADGKQEGGNQEDDDTREQTEGAWGEAGDEDTEGPDPEASGEASDSEVQELREQVKDLQEQVKTLMDAEEVRGDLEESEEEEREKEEDVLSSAGREYSLLQKGKLGLEYEIEYGYYPYDEIREQNIIEHAANHSIKNSFTLEYPLKNNLTVETDIPFVYKYDRVGAEDSKNVSDFGDVDFGLNYQPVRSGEGFPSVIIRTTLTTPMGRSPYDINSDTELSTGSGGYALGTSMSVSKSVDPVMVYGTLGYEYRPPIKDLDYKLENEATLERYDRGDTIEVSMGMGYSLSYNTSVTLGYSYTYTLEDKRYFKESDPQTYPTRASSSLSIGTSWRINPKLQINMTLGIDLTDQNYHSVSFRVPFEFDL